MRLLAPIVLVEDDANDAFFVRRAIEMAQIANPVIEFQSAEQARHAVATLAVANAPVLFILDFQLSGNESGIDFLRWLRKQDPPLGSTPAMMLTGSDRPEHASESSHLGTTCFLHKPVTERALIDAVQSLGCEVVSSLVSGRMALRIVGHR
jgi:DNA-binding NarL/FixJ family response regulator